MLFLSLEGFVFLMELGGRKLKMIKIRIPCVLCKRKKRRERERKRKRGREEDEGGESITACTALPLDGHLSSLFMCTNRKIIIKSKSPH